MVTTSGHASTFPSWTEGPYGIDDRRSAFTTFRSNLEITDLQQETVAIRERNVRDAVAAELTVSTSFLSGSYSRHTMIAPLAEADIDVFVILDPSYYRGQTPAGLLDRVKRVLLRT